PTCGFTEVGSQRRQLGEFNAIIQVNDRSRVELSWSRSGKVQQSTPFAVKKSHPDELKTLQGQAKEADKILTAQRHRLEQLLREERSWSYADFQSRYLDHPLMGTLARRLVWRFGESVGAWHDGRLVDERGKLMGGLNDTTRVSLWHPISASVEQV